MTPPMHALQKENDFARLFRRGKKHHFPAFMISVLSNPHSYNRFAFIVSASIEKSAVKRNRMRRRVREWVRKNQFKFCRSSDVAFLFRKDAFRMSRKKIYEELEEAVKKIFS
ncbi:MAG: ribonuclease P protein component [Candidatus Sungbacteria bacterium]|nr:ribonuclease P protein component [Candidatus Sungbacteria bacterium]